MSKEAIVERIAADAAAEAEELLNAAARRAAEIVSAAEARAREERAEAAAEAEERGKRLREGRNAAARLDSAKILLAEKRRVLDEIYARALGRLCGLDEREMLPMIERLLTEHAEEGDEIVFAKDFPYASAAAQLTVVRKRKLTVSKERTDAKGGFLLRGKVCDKDLSFSALLRADMEEHQGEIAEELFHIH